MKKAFLDEKELLTKKLLQIPAVSNCEVIGGTADGFYMRIEFSGGGHCELCVRVLKRAFPKQVMEIIAEISNSDAEYYPVVVAPYISETTDQLCRQNGAGYLDYSGNCFLRMGSLYISETGHPNQYVGKRSEMQIFKTSSAVSSMILRELLANVEKPWKLKHLSEVVGCSIGQVSNVKEYLCEQLWAEMTTEGLRISNPEGLLQSWSSQYEIAASNLHACYTLMPLPVFEEQLVKMKRENAIDSYLTGFAGGVRYAPVVRYNKIHLLVRAEDFRDFLHFSKCKPVDSGANVIVHTVTREDFLKGSRVIDGSQVASPVQVYLDCMQLKGRGEEMAEAVFNKEICK